MNYKQDFYSSVIAFLRKALAQLGMEPMDPVEDNLPDFDYYGYGPEYTDPEYGRGCFVTCISWNCETHKYYGNVYFLDEMGNRPFEFASKANSQLEKVIQEIAAKGILNSNEALGS